jgi:hypothetical protein
MPVQSEVEYEYFADRFTVRCQAGFSKVSHKPLPACMSRTAC